MRIETRGLGRSFGPVRALAGIDLAVPAGRRVGLVGPNGSGKSTLLRVVMGLLRFDGEVKVGGLDPRRERLSLAGRLAYVPQSAPALAAPVAELVRLISTVRAVPLAELDRVARALDFDLEARAAVPFRALSGGMKQKLLLALALSSQAELVVLDEPTASLDAAARERFFALLDEVAGSATRLFCSHRIDEVRGLVDRVVVLRDGVVDYDGPTAGYVEATARATGPEARS